LTTAFDARQRREIASRGRLLQYVTIAWNSAESVVALAAGFVAGSIALVGFGFDSAIEVTSSVAALWWLGREADEVGRARAEQRTMRIIGCCFLLLAAFVCYEAVHALVERKSPDHSTVGIVLAVLSLAVMPTLAHFKRRIASKLTSGALEGRFVCLPRPRRLVCDALRQWRTNTYRRREWWFLLGWNLRTNHTGGDRDLSIFCGWS
jgi:divalent metal cation (Fe/Co/Zn/Cd) transporter